MKKSNSEHIDFGSLVHQTHGDKRIIGEQEKLTDKKVPLYSKLVGLEKSKPEYISYDKIVKKRLGSKEFIDEQHKITNKDNQLYFKLISLEISRKINDHVRINFSGTIESSQQEEFIKMADSETAIEFDYLDHQNNQVALFRGIVTDIKIKFNAQNTLEIDGVSYTYMLDRELKSRSFPDDTMKYSQLIETVLAEYSGAGYGDIVTEGSPLKGFILQHLETDWEFLKRLASHFNTGLVATAEIDKPYFYFGIPDQNLVTITNGMLDNINGSGDNERILEMKKRTINCRDIDGKYIGEYGKKEILSYELRTYRVLNIGDTIQVYKKSTSSLFGKDIAPDTFSDTQEYTFYVYESKAVMEESRLNFYYQLVFKEELYLDQIYNQQITGLSLEGTVIGREKDYIRVHLQIDKDYEKEHKVKNNATQKGALFPYATPYTAEGNTGWYCMPEEGDTVNLYFPSHNENTGIILSSIRKQTQNGDKITDPAVKYFRHKNTEIRFSENNVLITLNQYDEKNKTDVALVSIELDEAAGLKIYGQKDLRLTAGNDIILQSTNGDIKISAGSLIDMVCKDSGLSMNGTTNLKGKKINEN